MTTENDVECQERLQRDIEKNWHFLACDDANQYVRDTKSFPWCESQKNESVCGSKLWECTDDKLIFLIRFALTLIVEWLLDSEAQ